jgi:hypothetical protein
MGISPAPEEFRRPNMLAKELLLPSEVHTDILHIDSVAPLEGAECSDFLSPITYCPRGKAEGDFGYGSMACSLQENRTGHLALLPSLQNVNFRLFFSPCISLPGMLGDHMYCATIFRSMKSK